MLARRFAVGLVVAALISPAAFAGSTTDTTTGAKTPHVGIQNDATGDLAGTQTKPFIVNFPSGGAITGSLATAAKQDTQTAALGAPADVAWTSGNGSAIAILKGIYASVGTGNTSLASILSAHATAANQTSVQGTPGSAAPSKGLLALGSDGTNARALKTASDGTVATTATLQAGSAVVGKVGSDQTTPQTSDLFTSRYSRTKIVSTSQFTLGTTYAAAGNNVGGQVFTLDLSSAVGANVATVKLRSIRFSSLATSFSATPQFFARFFNSTPTGTFTDGSTPTFTNNSLLVAGAGTMFITLGTGIGDGLAVQNQSLALTTNASGQLFVALTTNTAFNVNTPTASGTRFDFEFDY